MTSTKFRSHSPTPGSTFANQDALPKLPIPPLQDSCKRYLTALRGLQDDKEHAATTRAVQSFLQGDGPALQERLKQWAAGRARYASVSNMSTNGANVLRVPLHCAVISRTFGEISRLFRSLPHGLIMARNESFRYRYESYLSHSDPVVLALNPFFVLE